MKPFVKKIPLIICFLLAVVLSLKTLREPDLWWQIRTGEWIIQNGQVPQQDIFSYTYEGSPWVNIKWGFEVAAAFLSSALGPENVFLLQVLASCLLLWFVIRVTKRLVAKHALSIDVSDAIIPVALLLLLTGIAYRMIGRPEMISHVLTVVFLFLLLKNRENPGRSIFLLIPLQILWANFHEAFATGLVIIFAFTAGGWLEYYFGRKNRIPAKPKPLFLTYAAIASVLSIAVNPYGFKLFESPLDIFGQVFRNKYTTELLGIDSTLYWQKEAYIGLAMLIITLAGFLFSVKKKAKQKWYWQIAGEHGITPFILIALFTYLAATAYRNIIFLDLVIFPFFVVSLVKIVTRFQAKRWFAPLLKAVPVLSILAGIGFYISVVSNKYYRFTGSNDYYGLEVLSINNPSGASGYIDQNRLSGKRAFSDYLTSSYLLWKQQPAFKTFIDLRDLDVFPTSFFDRFAEAVSSPASFNRLDSQYQFDYVVLFRPQFTGLHYHLFHDSTYSLRFIDAVAAVYEKTDVKSNSTVFSHSAPLPQSALAKGISKVFNPFYAPYDYSQTNYEAEAASFFRNINEIGLARDYALRALQNPGERYKAFDLLGQIYYEQAVADTNPAMRQMLSDSAMLCFNASLKENPAYAPVLLDLGAVAYRRGQMKQAVQYFEDAVDADAFNVNAHLYAGEAYKSMANKGGTATAKNTQLALKHFLAAEKLDPQNIMTKATIGFLYFNLKDCDKVNEYLGPLQDFEGLPETERRGAKNCLNSCGY